MTVMGTIIGDYIGTTIGIHCPIPYQEPDSNVVALIERIGSWGSLF